MFASQMIAAYPNARDTDKTAIIAVIETAAAAGQAATACADACLGEGIAVELKQCVRLDLDCADICAATVALASRRTGDNRSVFLALVAACAQACAACAHECERHAHEHCRICAQACRACEAACRALAQG